jgi:hypothetical protein
MHDKLRINVHPLFSTRCLFPPFCASAKSLRSQTYSTVSPRKIISLLMSPTMRSCMPIHRSSPSMPACSVTDDEGSRTTFHAVSVLSL